MRIGSDLNVMPEPAVPPPWISSPRNATIVPEGASMTMVLLVPTSTPPSEYAHWIRSECNARAGGTAPVDIESAQRHDCAGGCINDYGVVGPDLDPALRICALDQI